MFKPATIKETNDYKVFQTMCIVKMIIEFVVGAINVFFACKDVCNHQVKKAIYGNTIMVKGRDLQQAELVTHFKMYGKIYTIRISSKFNKAFIVFSEPSSALNASKCKSQKTSGPKTLKVAFENRPGVLEMINKGIILNMAHRNSDI